MKQKQEEKPPNEKERQSKDTKHAESSSNRDKLLLIGGIPVVLLIAIVTQYFYNNYYVLPLQERTLLPPSPLDINRKEWTMIDPQSIFSMGSRHPDSLKFRIGMSTKGDETVKLLKSQLSAYQWIEGDGKSFGTLSILDEDMHVNVQFITLGDSWTTRVAAKREGTTQDVPQTIHFIFITPDSSRPISISDDQSKLLFGSNPLVANYSIGFDTLASETTDHRAVILDQPIDISSFSISSGSEKKKNGPTAVVSFDFGKEFDVEVSFSTEDSKEIVANDFVDLYGMASEEFEVNFEAAFKLKRQNMPVFYQSMGKTALSNILSSFDYYYGNKQARGQHNFNFELKNAELVTVPASPEQSKTDIDDQLFSLLAVLPFEKRLALQVVTSWLNLMNSQGNLPSTLDILNFSDHHTPMIFMILNRILETEEITTFKDIYPKLVRLFEGLVENLSIEENLFMFKKHVSFPYDYPRSRENLQAHLDMHCWMVIASRVMKKLAPLGSSTNSYDVINQKIDNIDFLVENYYDSNSEVFADIVRVIKDGKKLDSFHQDALGIVSMTPLMFKLLPADSKYLAKMLEQLDTSETLSSPFGIRSLSKSSSFYPAPSPTDLSRSDISLPSNFLILSSLKHYSEQSSSNQAAAHALYSKLRNNIIGYVAREFKRTKFLWQAYDDNTGQGKGSRSHHSSALVLNIMAEVF